MNNNMIYNTSNKLTKEEISRIVDLSMDKKTDGNIHKTRVKKPNQNHSRR